MLVCVCVYVTTMAKEGGQGFGVWVFTWEGRREEREESCGHI